MTYHPFAEYTVNQTLVAATSTFFTIVPAGGVGRIRWLNVRFTGTAAAGSGDLSYQILDFSSVPLFRSRLATAPAAPISFNPPIQIFNLADLDDVFLNGFQSLINSMNAGDTGDFSVNIGYDQIF